MREKNRKNFPEKTCPVCGRPFSWRKKWAASWPEIRYCSKKCRGNRHLIQEQA